ncbi:MAG: hypothetical protein Q9P90_13985 [candidate division KSB1 bacterium]|nr:hypothetical protein [candidate division KSB1 bacterium]
MSGRKYSDYGFDEERRQRSRSLSQVRNLLRDLGGVQQQLRETMQDISEGMRQQYRREIEDAEKWLQQCQEVPEQYQQLSLSNSASELSRAVNQVQNFLARGQQVQSRLQKVVGEALKQRRELNRRLSQLSGEWESHQEWVRHWLGDERSRQVQQDLNRAGELLRADAFAEARAQLQALDESMSEAVREATKKEAEHLRQQQAREFLKIKRDVEACAFSLRQTLQSASPGLQETFAQEANLARQWLQKEQDVRNTLSNVGEDSDIQALQSAAGTLQALFQEGQQVSEKVEQAFVVQASEWRQRAEAQVSEVESLFAGGREVLELWLSDEDFQDIEARVQQLREILKADRLREIEAPYQTLKTELEAKAKEAEEKEARHQQRMYLLKALRQVCVDMGFGEVEPPRFEREDDRGSRIVLTIDTYAYGTVTFFLSLEAIEADSCISDRHCFEEFDQLSQQLKDKFGVQTKFRMADGEEPPQLIRKGEKEEPDSGGLSQSAQG